MQVSFTPEFARRLEGELQIKDKLSTTLTAAETPMSWNGPWGRTCCLFRLGG